MYSLNLFNIVLFMVFYDSFDFIFENLLNINYDSANRSLLRAVCRL